ncbi:hypothetical protein DERP_007590 [Dermatophagoides pteronyssinus]|uniref:Uncharacterized protein n=1 Tax=Dermatophagoides pteronyssinus TaxID=6956 RepID=A0ABQ8JKB8_DERPT|nr:hypothetical protein DERP_007590 [Dermatophagoides pteronyssinus]
MSKTEKTYGSVKMRSLLISLMFGLLLVRMFISEGYCDDDTDGCCEFVVSIGVYCCDLIPSVRKNNNITCGMND